MPTPVRVRGGCKVGWKTYTTRREAEIAAKYAAKLADWKADLGFDFGWQSPGSIEEVPGGFEVCFP